MENYAMINRVRLELTPEQVAALKGAHNDTNLV